MTRNKYFFRNITVLNIILATFIVLMLSFALSPFFYAKVKFALPSLKKLAEEPKGVSSGEFVLESPSDYILIAEENLFHPERKIPLGKKAENELPKPEFVLYGTLRTDDISIAYIEDMKAPRSTPGRGRRQTALRTGDTLSGYILKEIDIDKIVMTRGEERITLSIIESHKAKRTVIASPVQTPVSKTIPTPPSPQSLIKPEPLTKKRAPMTPADERARSFFQR